MNAVNLLRPLNLWRLRRQIMASSPGEARLHLGCGPRLFPGWINIDLEGTGEIITLDLSRGLPLPEKSVDAIYSEDLIEHLERDAGRLLLADCYRALKPGGVMRLLTPNLDNLVKAYRERNEATLMWYRAALGCRTFGDLLNAGMRAWGHQYLYDAETLRLVLEEIGFKPHERGPNQSDEPFLQNLDSRDSSQGSLTMYWDAYK